VLLGWRIEDLGINHSLPDSFLFLPSLDAIDPMTDFRLPSHQRLMRQCPRATSIDRDGRACDVKSACHSHCYRRERPFETMPRFSIAFALATVLLAAPSLGFTVVPATTRSASASSSTSLAGFGSAFGDAFKNDDSLGKAENAGLKGGPKYNEQVTINGKEIKAVVGQPVKTVANAARVKIRYDCQKGDCGTCMIKMNGKKVKACQMKIPSGRCVIQTLD